MTKSLFGEILATHRARYVERFRVHLDGWDGGKLTFKDRDKLSEDAPNDVKTAFTVVALIDSLPVETMEDRDSYSFSRSQFGLLCTNLEALGMVMACDSLAAPLDTAMRLISGRSKGGRNSAKWTLEIEQTAKALLAKQTGSQSARIQRVAKQLSTNHGINLSVSTLKRRLL